jgi:hypothetical protein
MHPVTLGVTPLRYKISDNAASYLASGEQP